MSCSVQKLSQRPHQLKTNFFGILAARAQVQRQDGGCLTVESYLLRFRSVRPFFHPVLPLLPDRYPRARRKTDSKSDTRDIGPSNPPSGRLPWLAAKDEFYKIGASPDRRDSEYDDTGCSESIHRYRRCDFLDSPAMDDSFSLSQTLLSKLGPQTFGRREIDNPRIIVDHNSVDLTGFFSGNDPIFYIHQYPIRVSFQRISVTTAAGHTHIKNIFPFYVEFTVGQQSTFTAKIRKMIGRLLFGDRLFHSRSFHQHKQTWSAGIATEESLAGVSQPGDSQCNAFDFTFGSIMKGQRRFSACAATELSRARAALGVTPKQIKQRKIGLEPFNVMATESPRRVAPISVRPRPGAIQGALRESGYIVFAVLVDTRVPCQSVAGIKGHHLPLPSLTARQHLGERGVGDEFYRRPARRGIQRDRTWRLHVHHRSFRGDNFDGFQRPMIFRQIIGQSTEDRFIAGAEGRVIWHVDTFFGLRAAAREIEAQMISFFRQCEIDFPRILGLNNAAVTPLTVRNLRDSLSQNRFRVMNHFGRDRTNELRSIGFEHRLHS